MLKVLVTGGTGTIGKFVVRELLSKSYEVVVLTRKTINDNHGVKYINGDLENLAKVPKVDLVIHLAACLDIEDEKNCQKTNVKGTKALLEWAKENKVKKIVYVSTISVFRDSLKTERDERWGLERKPQNSYVRTKLLGLKLVKNSNLPIVTVYPTVVVDLKQRGMSGGGLRKWLWKISGGFNGSLMSLIGSGKRIINYVLVEDVARGIVLAMEKAKKGENFIMGGHNIDVASYLQLMSKYYRTKYLPFRIPWWTLKLVGKLVKIPASMKDMYFTNKKAVTELGFAAVSLYEKTP